MSIYIPLGWDRPPLSSNRVRGNVYARNNEVRRAKTQAAAELMRHGGAPWPTPCLVVLHYRVATWHRRDPDGLYPTLKVVLDAAVQIGALEDDGLRHVRTTATTIHPPNGKPAALWLTVLPVQEDA